MYMNFESFCSNVDDVSIHVGCDSASQAILSLTFRDDEGSSLQTLEDETISLSQTAGKQIACDAVSHTRRNTTSDTVQLGSHLPNYTVSKTIKLKYLFLKFINIFISSLVSICY